MAVLAYRDWTTGMIKRCCRFATPPCVCVSVCVMFSYLVHGGPGAGSGNCVWRLLLRQKKKKKKKVSEPTHEDKHTANKNNKQHAINQFQLKCPDPLPWACPLNPVFSYQDINRIS